MIESHEYTIHLDGTGPKTATLTSVDDLPPLGVASPPEFGGPSGRWSPEHLFVAAVSSCLMTTFQAISSMSGLEVVEYSDDASGHLIRDTDGLYRIESVTLRPRVVISDGDKLEKAHRLLEKAERACLVSRSVRAPVRLESTIDVLQRI
jgi:organic hydroperoxide reductase OsmC/OhrA